MFCLYEEVIKKLSEDRAWKEAKPTFSCDLWNSKCLKECFTTTAQWIEYLCTENQPRWVLWQKILGSYPVQDFKIDHQGACTWFLEDYLSIRLVG